MDTRLSTGTRKAENVGRIADRTAERLVVGSEGTLATRKKKRGLEGRGGEGGEGEREKWRPRAEITFVFLIWGT